MGDDFMKSALDRAMERADQIELSADKLNEIKYRSEGEKLAAEFMKISDYDLAGALQKHNSEIRHYIVKALQAVLLRNLVLPRKESDIIENEKVMKGLATFKRNKNIIKQATEQINNLSNYYAQARKQHYDQLKAQVEQAMANQIMQQTGAPPSSNLNVEQTPQFQEHWRQVSAQLDGEYEKALVQLKEQIASTD